MRWLIRITVSLLLLALIGVGYQMVGMMTDQEQYLPPGELIDVGGHALHLYCTGEGSPTVVLEAMGTGWSVYWAKVQPELSKTTRVCSYDRAGFGWSESGPLPRTGTQIAEELHQLLTRGGISGPMCSSAIHSAGSSLDYIARPTRTMWLASCWSMPGTSGNSNKRSSEGLRHPGRPCSRLFAR